MTAPDHIDTEPDVVTDPIDVTPDQSDEDVDALRTQLEAAHQVLDLAGIPYDKDAGNFNPEDLEEWHETTKATRERARRALIEEAGFDPSSPHGELMLRMVDAGELEATPTSIEAYGSERGWTPNAAGRYSLTEAEQLLGQRKLDAIHSESTSDTTGMPETEIDAKIAEAREEGDWQRASRLQSEYERKKVRQ